MDQSSFYNQIQDFSIRGNNQRPGNLELGRICLTASGERSRWFPGSACTTPFELCPPL